MKYLPKNRHKQRKTNTLTNLNQNTYDQDLLFIDFKQAFDNLKISSIIKDLKDINQDFKPLGVSQNPIDGTVV